MEKLPQVFGHELRLVVDIRSSCLAQMNSSRPTTVFMLMPKKFRFFTCGKFLRVGPMFSRRPEVARDLPLRRAKRLQSAEGSMVQARQR